MKLLLKIAITFALLYYLINYVSYKEIILAINGAEKIYILFSFLLMFLNIYFQFLKWRLVCNVFLNVHDNLKIWKSLFYGFSAGLVTPIRVGEYLGRKLAIEDVSILKITIATILEKFASLFIILVIGGFASIYFINQYYSFLYSIPIILFLLVLLIVATLVSTGYNFSSKLFNRLTENFSFFKNLKTELSYVNQIGLPSIKKLMIYSSLFYFVVIVQYAILALAFEVSGNFFNYLLAGIIILFVKSILSFLSFADLGIRETTSVFLLNKMGHSAAVGFNSAIFLFLFNLLIPSIIGMFLLFARNEKGKETSVNV